MCQDNSNHIRDVTKGGQLSCSGKDKIKIYKANMAVSNIDVCPLHFKDPVTLPVCSNLVGSNVTSILERM